MKHSPFFQLRRTALLLLGAVFLLDASTELKAGSKTSDSEERVTRTIEGWTISIDPRLARGDGEEALEMLANHLQRIAILIPEPALEKMRELVIWIDQDHPRLKGMQYHPSKQWLVANEHTPELAKKVHICRAEQLLSREQMLKHPAVILHELAHGYHDQFLSFDNEKIMEAYQAAKESGNYENVLLYTGKTVSHYGLNNHKEYFAEGVEAYFYRNDFYPFVRAELHEFDPQLESVIQECFHDDR